MEVISIDKTLTYGGPSKIADSLDTTHRVITTNIPGDTIEGRIQKAQVVILLEEHDDEKVEGLNGRVIKLHWKGNDLLLVEGEDAKDDITYLPKSITSKAQNWDLKLDGALINLYSQLADLFVHIIMPLSTQYALTLDASSESLKQFDPAFISIFKTYDSANWESCYSQFVLMGKGERIQYLQEIIRGCLFRIVKCEDDENKLHIAGMCARNKNLAKSIQSALKKHERVWVLAGEAHGRYCFSQAVEGVAALYSSLESEKVHYLTLKWFDNQLEEADYSHDAGCAEFLEKAHIERRQQAINSMREAMEGVAPTEETLPFIQLQAFKAFIEEVEEDDIDGKLLLGRLLLERMLTWSKDYLKRTE